MAWVELESVDKMSLVLWGARYSWVPKRKSTVCQARHHCTHVLGSRCSPEQGRPAQRRRWFWRCFHRRVTRRFHSRSTLFVVEKKRLRNWFEGGCVSCLARNTVRGARARLHRAQFASNGETIPSDNKQPRRLPDPRDLNHMMGRCAWGP